MSFDLENILESKRAFRRDLAVRPIAEKLRMLDALRERELASAVTPTSQLLPWHCTKNPRGIAPGPNEHNRKFCRGGL